MKTNKQQRAPAILILQHRHKRSQSKGPGIKRSQMADDGWTLSLSLPLYCEFHIDSGSYACLGSSSKLGASAKLGGSQNRSRASRPLLLRIRLFALGSLSRSLSLSLSSYIYVNREASHRHQSTGRSAFIFERRKGPRGRKGEFADSEQERNADENAAQSHSGQTSCAVRDARRYRVQFQSTGTRMSMNMRRKRLETGLSFHLRCISLAEIV